jgi:uncharacterized protein YuzE
MAESLWGRVEVVLGDIQTMKIKFDALADAAYVELKKGTVHKTLTSDDRFLIDLDEKGSVLGFEMLHYSKLDLPAGLAVALSENPQKFLN